MTILIASDHAGFERKQKLISYLRSLPHIELQDFGPFDSESVDYPDFADKVCRHLNPLPITFLPLLTKPTTIGILICGSGQGMAMRANKFPQIRAALCWNEESAKLSREHNDANVLCLGARFVDDEMTQKIADCFMKTPFAQGRHSRRVVKLGAKHVPQIN